MGKILKVFVIICFIVLCIVLGIENIEPLKEQYITFRADLGFVAWETKPILLGALIPFSFVIGLMIMFLYSFGTVFGLKRQVKKLTKELNTLRVETGYGAESNLPALIEEEDEEEQEQLE